MQRAFALGPEASLTRGLSVVNCLPAVRAGSYALCARSFRLKEVSPGPLDPGRIVVWGLARGPNQTLTEQSTMFDNLTTRRRMFSAICGGKAPDGQTLTPP